MKRVQQNENKRAQKSLIGLLFLVFFLFLLAGCAPSGNDNTKDGSGDPSSEGSENNTQGEMLGSLGINVDSVEPRTDPQNKTLPTGYNPLGGKIGSFNPTKELFFLRSDYSLKLREYEAGANWPTLFDKKNVPWMSYPKSSYKVTNGDVDGDGFDEIVVVYELRNLSQIKIIVIEDKKDGFSEADPLVISSITKTSGGLKDIESVKAANLDDDAAMELIVNSEGTIYLFDDKNTNFSLLESQKFPADITANHTFSLDLSIGNIDGDSQDEFMIIQNILNTDNNTSRIVNYYIYDSSFSKLLKSDNNVTITGSSETLTMDQVKGTFGDIDGDGLDEIIFYSLDTISPTTSPIGLFYLIYIDDAMNNFAALGNLATTATSSTDSSFTVKSLDVDGDAIDEILVTVDDITIRLYDDLSHGMTPIDQIDLSSSSPNYFEISVGNINEDRFDDVIVRYDSSKKIRVYEYDENTKKLASTKTIIPGAGISITDIGLANVDDDSIVLEYRNEHELLFTDPTVLAVVSAPPFHGSLGVNQADSSTIFGEASSEGSSKMSEFGFSVSASIGVTAEAPLCGSTCFSVSAKVKIAAAFDWSATHSFSKEEKYYYTAVNEDQVIFTAVPFDVYYYNVISAGSEAASSVGEVVTINIPRKPITTSAERSFYNDHNGDTTDITDELVKHTVGDVGSYMTKSDKNNIVADYECENKDLGCLYSNKTQTVGIGSGSSNSLGISKSATDQAGFSFNGEISIEADMSVGGFTMGTSRGFHYGYNISTETGDETFILGTVGYIANSAFSSDLLYDWGMLAYPTLLNGGYQFTLVNYWVENYNPN